LEKFLVKVQISVIVYTTLTNETDLKVVMTKLSLRPNPLDRRPGRVVFRSGE